MANIIPVDKTQIPYTFEIRINNRLYTLGINYNSLKDFFTVDLLEGTTVLATGEKMILNREMFRDIADDRQGNLDTRFPNDIIIPVSPSSGVERITFDNFGESTYLFIATRDSLGIV